jgi:diguanylate cyclase (GGDEF)-like protein/PAS domain S-box-containing protein
LIPKLTINFTNEPHAPDCVTGVWLPKVVGTGRNWKVAMYPALGALARLVATPAKFATAETVVAACEHVRDLLGAEEAYVLRSGDPHFIRIGCDDDPAAYEIKQRGYWHAWRESAANPEEAGRLLTVRERLVEEIAPITIGMPATHLAAILPGDESNSEILVVRGPWPDGLNAEQVELANTIRPLMAYLVANVLDAGRQDRVRSQMRVLAEIAEAFTQAEEQENALASMATALARASGFAWVAILLFDSSIERVEDRAVNMGRHSNTETAAKGRQGQESENSRERDIRVARHVATTRQPYCVPDVSDPNEQVLVNDELRPYYESAHIISMASYPVHVQDQMLGTITFCASEPHQFDETEQEFLWSLVAQAAPTIKAFRLNRELRQAEQRLRAVFMNAPVFISVLDAEGTILLSEGAGLMGLGQRAGALVGSSVFDSTPEQFHASLHNIIERGLAGENFDTTIHINGGDFHSRYAPLRDETGTPTAVIGVTVDVSEQHRAERALRKANSELQAAKEKAEELARQAEFLVRHDALTGVLSRRAWFDEARKARPSAVAIVDVDAFKSVNDRFGHPAGDVVLRSVAERIAGAVQGHGVLGRLGGEEFGIFFTGSLEEAEALCARSVTLIGAVPCLLSGGGLLRVTVSAGLAPCRRPGAGIESAIIDAAYEEADLALYDAKAGGRHRLVARAA